jgi:hypothetical protein
MMGFCADFIPFHIYMPNACPFHVEIKTLIVIKITDIALKAYYTHDAHQLHAANSITIFYPKLTFPTHSLAVAMEGHFRPQKKKKEKKEISVPYVSYYFFPLMIQLSAALSLSQ